MEGERSTARRLRKERDAVVAKHKQAMAHHTAMLDNVAHSITYVPGLRFNDDTLNICSQHYGTETRSRAADCDRDMWTRWGEAGPPRSKQLEAPTLSDQTASPVAPNG